MLLTGLIALFRSERLDRLDIHALEAGQRKDDRPAQLLDHDWAAAADQFQIITRWLCETLDVAPNVGLYQKPHELLHGRVLTIDWASGIQSKVILDQGLGYWKPHFQHSNWRRFDFYQSIDEQIEQMLNKFELAKMLHSGVWPTYITVIAC